MDEKITKQDVKDIVNEAINGAVNGLAVVFNQAFAEQQKYMDSKINHLDNKINYLDKKIDNRVDELIVEISELKDDHRRTLESNEKIATEIKDTREEQAAIIGGRERVNDTLLDHDDKIEDHNKRIIILETPIKSQMAVI